jgi:preprotein translocase subunit YajC
VTVSSPLLSSDLLLAQNVQPKATSPGVAQDSSPAPATSQGGGSTLSSLSPILMMLAIFVPVMLLMSRKQKKDATARAQMKKGDRVLSSAGFLGEMVEFDEKIAKVKIAPGTVVQVMTNTLAPYVEAPAKGAAPSAKELKEAKAGSEKK